MHVSHRVSRLVEWADTDAAGIMHFSAFFLLMEEAEHEFLRSLRLSVTMAHEGRTISWPRVASSCEFQGAARFEDRLDIDVAIERLGAKSATYVFHITRDDEPIAAGKMTSVCCVIEPHQPPRAIEIPPFFSEKLRPFVAPNL